MDRNPATITDKIARAARAVERQKTTRGREWLPVFMNDDAVELALHGFLTPEETNLALDSAGADRIRTLHRRMVTVHPALTSFGEQPPVR